MDNAATKTMTVPSAYTAPGFMSVCFRAMTFPRSVIDTLSAYENRFSGWCPDGLRTWSGTRTPQQRQTPGMGKDPAPRLGYRVPPRLLT